MTYDEYVTWISHSNEYWQGYNAYSNNMSRLDNAYDKSTTEHGDWDDGWAEASLKQG